jgi:mannan endo-1,4-beta-mannosidase
VFILVNAYYLQEEAARGRIDLVDETLAECRAMGAGVVRTWAFNDDPNKLDTHIQRAAGVYSEAGLHGLDCVLERARARGIKLILPLVNYWNAYGGARQWLLWHGVADAREGDPRFFTDERVRAHYAAHVGQLLDRENPLTGVRYGDDDTVLAWELMNEPRTGGLPPDVLADWARFAARAIKSRARQRVSAGDEGELAVFRLLLAEGDLDLASCHFYPHKYGVPPGDERAAGIAWIEERARLAAAFGKPLVVGEFGIANGVLDSNERVAIYRAWIEAAARAGAAGIGPWLFAYGARPAAWDEFTFYAGDPIATLLEACSRTFAAATS